MKLWIVAVLALLGCTSAFAQSSQLTNEINGNAASPYVGYNLQVIALKQLLLDMASTFPNTVVYGADATGATDSSGAINNVLAGLASTGGTVFLPAGKYLISSSIAMQPNVALVCQSGTTITQGNGNNLHILIDFSANTASGAKLINCIIDGNRFNNTDNFNNICVYGGTANDVYVVNNTIQNCNGYAIDWGAGLRFHVVNNIITNFFFGGIAAITGAAQTGSNCEIASNRITQIGAHGIILTNADFCSIRNNTVIGNIVGPASGTTMMVNTSASSVNWVSGPTFVNVKAGNFLVLNGGQEFFITAVNSNTSLTLSASPGSLTNVAASIGSGDLIQIDSTSYAIVDGNYLLTNVTDGISLSDGTGNETSQQNRFINNTISSVGEIGIALITSGGLGIANTSILSNSIIDPGQGNAIANGGFDYGIYIAGTGAVRTLVDSNSIRDDQGTPTTTYWLSFGSILVGQVIVGNNAVSGVVNQGINNDVQSITLTGWGSTAASSAITSYGNSVQFTITANGTGITANPDFVVFKGSDVPQNNPPQIQCKQASGTDAPQLFYGESSSILGEWVGFYNGTPSAAHVFVINCK